MRLRTSCLLKCLVRLESLGGLGHVFRGLGLVRVKFRDLAYNGLHSLGGPLCCYVLDAWACAGSGFFGCRSVLGPTWR